MSKIRYPDNFKIEVVNYYRMHKNITATIEKYGIARSTLFKWKQKYESNHFSKIGKEKAEQNTPQVRSHKKKVQDVMTVRKECGCPITASTEDKVATVLKLKGKYSIHVLCESVQLPRGTFYNRLRRIDHPTTYELPMKN